LDVDPFAKPSSSRMSTPARTNLPGNPRIDINGQEIKNTGTPQVNGYGFVVTPSPMPGAHRFVWTQAMKRRLLPIMDRNLK